MAAPNVTYTFVNATTSDATQVNQNFTDVINGITDGSKDLTINSLTLNGSLTVGNAIADTLTINAVLSSSIALNTTFTYDLGTSTVGFRDIYLGSIDSAAKTTKIRAGTVGTSYTLSLPNSAGTSRFRTLTNGSGALSFEEVRGSNDIKNLSISASVAASALTIALKGADGNDPSATNVVECSFRSSTAATGTPLFRTATAATSLVISSGSTLGHASGIAQYIYIYLLDNAGTLELAASSSFFDEGTRRSTTAEGGGGASDVYTTIYSTAARSNVGIRLIGRFLSTQATAGTWATAISEISLLPFSNTNITPWNSSLAYIVNGCGTVSGSSFLSRRVGDSLEVTFYFKTGTVAASTASITLPTGFTIDTSKCQGGDQALFGFANNTTGAGGAGNFTAAVGNILFYDAALGNTAVAIGQINDTTANSKPYKIGNGSAFFSTNDSLSGRFTIPITEWA